MKKIKFIYGDLSRTFDYKENIFALDTRGTNRDLEKYNIQLEKDKEYWFYTDDVDGDSLIYQARVDFDELARRWIAEIKTETLKHLSESEFAREYTAKEIEDK